MQKIYVSVQQFFQKNRFCRHIVNRFWKSINVRSRVVVSAAVFTSCSLLWYWQSGDKEGVGQYLEPNRNYQLIPFDITDATAICSRKTAAKYGSMLVRSYVDRHSTRFDSSAGIYKVFMLAHVGSEAVFDEAAVHCFVNPSEYIISHYRTFEKKRESLINRSLDFFSG